MTLYAAVGPATDIKIGAYGAAEGASTSVGSMTDFKLTPSREVEYGTHGAYRNARTDAYAHTPAYAATFTVDDATKANLAYALSGDSSGTDVLAGSAFTGSLTTYVVYVKGLSIAGTAKGIKLNKCVFTDPSEWATSNEQQTWEITMEVLYDATACGGAEFWTTYDSATDTTAPTVSSFLPVDGATAVACGTTFRWTWGEEIMADDVDTSRYFLHSSSGVVVSGSVAVYNASATVVEFTPSGNLGASGNCVYHAIATAGQRDIAGNRSTVTYSTEFTTSAS